MTERSNYEKLALLFRERQRRGTSPLMEIDRKIIYEIAFALRAIKEELLSSILEDYGKISDKDLLLKIQKFNAEFDMQAYINTLEEEDEEGNYHKKFARTFVDIGGDFTIDVRKIGIVSRKTTVTEHSTNYMIVLNQDPSEATFHNNLQVNFTSEKLRDYEYYLLKKKLKHSDTIFL